jgi:hypothetical protein
MASIPERKIQAYRARTHRLEPGLRLRSPEEAVTFVNERGFVYFWPIREIVLPSLWTAVAGDRPVADEHDDPGHATWGWKDDLLGKRRWYYAKLLRKRATMVSLETAPYFYALTENYGSPEEDYLTLYQQGRMTLESKLVMEVLIKNGALDTIALRRETHLTNRESDSRFNKAVTDLQANMLILPVGVSQAGRWHYSFIYDLVHRHFPDLIDRTRMIADRQARRKLAELYIRSVGVLRPADVSKLFSWTPDQAGKTLEDLVEVGLAIGDIEIEDQHGKWYITRELLES